jgi:transcriptional regulator with XRE-family HTH domain
MDRNLVARRLREARLRAGLTEVDVRDRIGISTRTVRAYEHAERLPGAQALAKLTRLYGVSADWVLGDAEREHPGSSSG